MRSQSDPNKNTHKLGNSKNDNNLTKNKKINKKFWKAVFTGIEELKDGFYYTNPQYLGEMVIWGTQNIRTGGRQLNAGGINSIAYGKNRDERE